MILDCFSPSSLLDSKEENFKDRDWKQDQYVSPPHTLKEWAERQSLEKVLPRVSLTANVGTKGTS